MADKTVQELTQPQAFGESPNLFQVAEQNALQVKRDKNISLTSAGQQVNTWFANAADNSMASTFGEWLATPNYKADSNFAMDDDIALHALSENKLGMNEFGNIRGSKSLEEMNFQILRAQRDAEFRKTVENQLTYDGMLSQANTSAFAGQVLDEVAIGVMSGFIGNGAALMTGGTRATTMAIATDISLESGLSLARYNTNDDYTMNDMFVDMSFGLAPSAIIALTHSRIYQKGRKSASEMNNQTQKNADEALDTTDETPTTPPKDGETPTTPPKDGEPTTPVVKDQPEPALATVKDMNSPTTRGVIKRLRASKIKNLPVMKVVDELARTVRKYKNAKTEKTRLRLADDIAKLEQTPEVKLVLQSSKMIDDPTFMKQMEADIKDFYAMVDNKSAKAMIDSVKKQVSKEDFELFEKIIKNEDIDPATLSKATGSKIAGTLLAAMVIPQIVEASGGEGTDVADALIFTAVAVAFGAAGISFIKSSGGIKEAATRVASTWDGKKGEVIYETSEEASALRKVAVKLSNSLDTELTNTKNLFTSNVDAMELVDEMVGKGHTIDMEIRTLYEGAMGNINRLMRDNFEAWKKVNEGGTLDDFNKLATEYIDNPKAFPKPDPHIQKMVDGYHDIMEEMYDGAKASGAKGFEKFKYDRTRTPRLWKSEQMKKLFEGMVEGSDDYNAVVKNLEDAFTQSVRDYRATKADADEVVFKGKSDAVVAKAYTEKFVKLWTDKRFANFTRKGANRDASKIKEYLVKNKIVDADDTDMLDDLVESLVPQSQVSARAKRRVVFNPNYLQKMSIKFDGKPMTIDKTTFIERDLMQIADMTSKELSITTGYSNKGFVTRSMMEDKILEVAKTDAEYDTLMDYKRLLEGQPTLTNSPFVESFIALSRVAVSIVKLPLVAFSTLPEFMNVLARSDMITGASALGKSMIKSYPPKGEVMQIRDITGLASFNDRLYRKGYIGYDELNDKLNPNATLMKFAKTAEDWAYTINRLGWLTDVTQMAGIEANLKQLRKFTSTGKGLPPSRLDDYGINQKWLDEFTPELAKPELDMASWTPAKKNRFGIVMKSLNQTISPETMLHTKGLWTSTTSFGRALSPLLNYSGTVFNEQGLPLLRHTDRHSVVNNVNAVVGAFIGLNLKYALDGKEVDQTDVLTYAITGAPLAGGFGIARGLLNPATLGVTGDIYNIVAPEAIQAR